MYTITVTTSQNIDIDYEVATLGNRIAARVIDYGIFFMLYYICIMAFTGLNSKSSQAFDNISFIVVIVVWLAVCVFYDLLFEILMNGQSLGKRAMKIKIISLNGARPTISQYLLRWVFRITDFGISFGSLAVVTVALSDKKQRLGDIVAGTTLIKVQPRNKLNDLVFGPTEADYVPTYPEVTQLSEADMALVYDVIKNFNRTRNNELVYRLALRIKQYLKISCPREVNEYQFLEIVIGKAVGAPVLYSIYSLAVLIPGIAAGVRRMHDVNKSGWFLLIPFYNLVLACTDGTPGENEYGEDPKGRSGFGAADYQKPFDINPQV